MGLRTCYAFVNARHTGSSIMAGEFRMPEWTSKIGPYNHKQRLFLLVCWLNHVASTIPMILMMEIDQKLEKIWQISFSNGKVISLDDE